ncbi:MAG: anthranilate phosphoribosyltransferase [Planctomycetota bacterium]|nr:anthranilate phosphoribosyltransferase [Planctomycetota bacterium]
MIRMALEKLLAGADLTEAEAAGVMTQILEGRATQAQMAAYLVALRCKGESVSELVGSVRCMRRYALGVKSAAANAVDLCGTGGDGKCTFNISTTAAFVVAGAGVEVAKHGNRAASSRCGSADLLEELGVALDLRPEHVAVCIAEASIGFMFAPVFHPAMKNIAPVRKELGVRTIFNMLGPLANPANVRRQLIGVASADLVGKFAEVLQRLDAHSAVVVHSRGGYDEATTTHPSDVAVLRSGGTAMFTLEPAELGFAGAAGDSLMGGSPKENAVITRRILAGEAGPRTDTVLLNAGLALWAAGAAADAAEGVALARESVESGNARERLDRLARLSRSLAEKAA